MTPASKKMNPLTVRVYEEKSRKVDTRFLDMCTTSGTDAATAKAIFDKMSGVLSNYKIPLDNCIGLGVDIPVDKIQSYLEFMPYIVMYT